MQPGATPEDLHAILSRFHTWAERHPANGGSIGKSHGRAAAAPAEGIREIPYEEAMRRHRSREAARNPRRAVPRIPVPPLPATKAAPKPAANPPAKTDDELPAWIAGLPVVPITEAVIELKAAPPETVIPPPPANAPLLPPLPASVAKAQRAARSSPAKRPSVAKTTQPATPPPADAALPEFPARAFVDLPPASLAPRHRPRQLASHPPQPEAEQAALPAVPPTPPPVVTALSPALPAKRSQARAASARVQPAARQQTTTRPNAQAAPQRPTRSAAPRSGAVPSFPRTKPHSSARPQFSKILANTVQQPRAALDPKRKPASARDRSRRITTRFSAAEGRRIEKCAAGLGITVSAYLRQCALAAVVGQTVAQESVSTDKYPKARRPSVRSARQVSVYAAPQPSFLGGWLALLRNRFLGPPIRFSEEA